MTTISFSCLILVCTLSIVNERAKLDPFWRHEIFLAKKVAVEYPRSFILMKHLGRRGKTSTDSSLS